MIFITDSKAACTGPLGDGYDDCVAFELTNAPRFSASSICDYREAIGMTSSWDSVNGVLTISIDPNTGDGIPAVRHPLHDGEWSTLTDYLDAFYGSALGEGCSDEVDMKRPRFIITDRPIWIDSGGISTHQDMNAFWGALSSDDGSTGVYRRLLVTADSARIRNDYFNSIGSYVDDDDVSKSETPPFGVGRDERYGVCGDGRAQKGLVQPVYPETFVGSAPNCFP